MIPSFGSCRSFCRIFIIAHFAYLVNIDAMIFNCVDLVNCRLEFSMV